MMKVLIVFMVWGAICTLPYIRTYGFDALRDGVVWGYGMFSFIAASLFLKSGRVLTLIKAYRWVFPWLLIWIPVARIISLQARDIIPTTPGSGGVALLSARPGDFAVHVAGIGAFLALGLFRVHGRGGWREALWWPLWLFSFLTVLQNRGGMLAVCAAMGLALLLRANLNRIINIAVVTLLATSLFVMSGKELDLGDRRSASPQQFMENITSIVGGQSGEEGLTATRDWRLDWWKKIIDYTVFGEHFVTGKGYGINLAVADHNRSGREARDRSLRSPHNGHLTVLARSGVPGFVLWIVLQSAFGLLMLGGFFRARRGGRDWWARVHLWILCYWVAFLINIGFTVYLEGPQGGIPFWCLFGLGSAIILHSRGSEEEESRPGEFNLRVVRMS